MYADNSVFPSCGHDIVQSKIADLAGVIHLSLHPLVGRISSGMNIRVINPAPTYCLLVQKQPNKTFL